MADTCLDLGEEDEDGEVARHAAGLDADPVGRQALAKGAAVVDLERVPVRRGLTGGGDRGVLG